MPGAAHSVSGAHAGSSLLALEKEWQEAAYQNAEVQALSDAVVGRYLMPPGRPPIFRREYLFASLLPVRGLRVLELGCGDGHTAMMLALAGAHVTAVDLSETAIAQARAEGKSRCLFVAASAQQFLATIEPGHFDLVLGDSFLHHVLPDMPRMLANVRRALKQGGRAVFAEPLAISPVYRKLRRLLPKRTDVSEGERPLEQDELDTIRGAFSYSCVTLFELTGRLASRLPHDYECAPLLERMIHYGARKVDWLVLNQLKWARSWAGYGVIACWK